MKYRRMDLQDFLFKGANTNGFEINIIWCIETLCRYLYTRKRYDWVVDQDNVMLITTNNGIPVVKLQWHQYYDDY